jgi:translation initiation factor 1
MISGELGEEQTLLSRIGLIPISCYDRKFQFSFWRGNMQNGIVYSTEHGKMCPICSKPVAKCVCGQKKEIPRGDGIVRIGRETKGRKGKGVTVITGIPLNETALKELVKQLKAKCGAGGTVKDGVIEIQGDHRDLLLEELRKRGWTVKSSAG